PLFFFSSYSHHRDLHSFPTRRSSDLETPGAGVDVRGPQPHAQQMISAEHVQRQIAVVSVVAVKKTRFLPSVQRRVGGVQVQHDLDRKSTRLNSSHLVISYAVFCLKKK